MLKRALSRIVLRKNFSLFYGEEVEVNFGRFGYEIYFVIYMDYGMHRNI